MTPVEVWGKNCEKNWAKFSGRNFLGMFVLHLLCRTAHQNFSPNSSQFITQCLVTTPVAEISKFHLRELLVGESLRGNRIGATGLRASERKSASESVSERVSEREGFQRFLRGF